MNLSIQPRALQRSAGLLFLIPLLSPASAWADAPKRGETPPSPPIEKNVDVPRLESAQAQLKYAGTQKLALRGLEGDARNGARKVAVQAYRAVRENWPADAAACAESAFRAGELLRSASETQAALAEFAIARERGGDSPFRVRAILEIGNVQRRAQNHQEALAAYEAVLADAAATQRQRDDASLWAGHVYAALDRHDDARRAWQRVADTAEDPLDRVRAYDCLALALIEKGDLEGAAGTLERCREALSEASAEESKLGERVRNALLGMRANDDLEKAVAKRDKEKSDGKKSGSQ